MGNINKSLNYIDTEALSAEYKAMMERFYEKGGGTPRDPRKSTSQELLQTVINWIDWSEGKYGQEERTVTNPYYGRDKEGKMLKYSGIVPKSVLEDIQGGKQYIFSKEDFSKIKGGNALAFVEAGKSFLQEGEDYTKRFHPYQQELIKAHEASHAMRDRGDRLLGHSRKQNWYERPEEQLAERESGEFMLRKANLLGKYNPLQIMELQRLRNIEWEENPDAPVSSVVFKEPERSIRKAVQERPVMSMPRGERSYISREGSALPQLSSVVSKEIPEDIKEHWKLKAESIKNTIKINPNILLTEEGKNLLSNLRVYEKAYPSYYENVAVPLSELDNEMYKDLK